MSTYLLKLFPNTSKSNVSACNHGTSNEKMITEAGTPEGTPAAAIEPSSTATSVKLQQDQMKVSFHPSVVTDIHIRPSTPDVDKSKFYFTRGELKRYRDQERSQLIQKSTIMAMIQGQQKYHGGHDGTTVVSRVSIMQN